MQKNRLWLVALMILLTIYTHAQNTFPTNGNVGIGTTSPSDYLNINGNDTNKVGIGITNSSGSQTNLTLFNGGSSGYGVPGWANASILESESQNGLVLGSINSSGNGIGGPITFQISRSAVAVINTAGNVGIGTTTPGAKLDVAGNLRLSGSEASINFPDGSTQTTAFNPNGIGSPINVTVGSGSTQSNIAIFTNGTNGAYTSIAGAGSLSQVPTWSDGSQILEFDPYGSGNGIVSSYTGNLLFQTNGRINQMAILANGNIGVGTISPGAKLDVAGNLKLSGGGASITFPDGSTQSTAWNGTLGGGDYAESVDVSGDRKSYEPGDVLVIDPRVKGRFLKSTEPYSTSVMGIYSTKPGLTGRRQLTVRSQDEVPMAMMGILPTKVSTENGPVLPGDLLVTSSTPGYAMKGTDRGRMLGALIGKALEGLDSGTGIIEVGITLQ